MTSGDLGRNLGRHWMVPSGEGLEGVEQLAGRHWMMPSPSGNAFSSLEEPGTPAPSPIAAQQPTPRATTPFFSSFPSMAPFATDPRIREQYASGQGPFSRLHQAFTQ